MSTVQVVRSKGEILKDRLRHQVDSGQRTIGFGSLMSDGKSEWSGGQIIYHAANPDGLSAIEYIEELERELASR